ncbi:hypothetical protein DL96DRAFT_495063 [Flagelloscypha sp. PMI_526]|nr:hypothetical protein DL96DRAFT_495063 [Flagelloscypha sp. PMI_526]
MPFLLVPFFSPFPIPPPIMTPLEAEYLKVYGESVIGNYCIFLVQTLLTTLGVVLYVISTYMLLRRPVKGKGTVFLLALTTLSVVIMITNWAAAIYDNTTVFKIGLVGLPGSTIETQFTQVLDRNEWVRYWEHWQWELHLFICDTIVVSRVWAIFPERRRERWFAGCVLLCDIVIMLVVCVYDLTVPLTRPSLEPKVMPIDFYLLVTAISLLTNIVATGLIGWKAICYRRSLKSSGLRVTSKSKHTPVHRILALFIESGIAFIGLQIVMLVGRVVPAPDRTPFDIAIRCISTGVLVTAAFYPSIVIIVIEQKRGILDETQYFGTGIEHTRSRSHGLISTSRVNRNGGQLSEMVFAGETMIPERTYQSRRTQDFVVSFSLGGPSSEKDLAKLA